MINREAIYAALFMRLRSATGWATASRILLPWHEVAKDQQPAMFQTQVSEHMVPKTGYGTVITLKSKVWVYVNSETTNGVVPSSQLNILADLITGVLQPDNGAQENQTLGGLVNYCRIEGDIQTDEGTLGTQAVMIIPIVMQTIY